MADRGGVLRTMQAAALTAAAVIATGGQAAAAPAKGIVAEQVTQSPEAALDYWTPERMRAAEPIEPPASPGAGTVDPGAQAAAIPPDQETDPSLDALFPQRVHGKLFLILGGQGAECSATVVNSRDDDLIVTAGHCLADPATGDFAELLVFVPGYRNGVSPFGGFAATDYATPKAWALRGHPGFDFGAIELAPSPIGLGLIQDAVGARGIAFNRSAKSFRRDDFELYGYPAAPAPYDGERLILCVSRFRGFEGFTGAPVVSPCHQQEGSSGGGWVRKGKVESLISHGGCAIPSTACTLISGSYFGETEFKIYRRLGGISKGKKNKLKRCKKAAKKKRIKCRGKVQRFTSDSG